MSGFKDRMRGAKRGPGVPARASDQRVRKEDVGGRRDDTAAPRNPTDRPPRPRNPTDRPPRPRPGADGPSGGRASAARSGASLGRGRADDLSGLGPARREDSRDQRGQAPFARDTRGQTPFDRRDDRDAPLTPQAPSTRDAYQRDRDDAGSRRTAEPRVTGPGERIVYGTGPVREIVARNPKSIRAIWVDPRRADKSAGDPVAQIVTKARLEGILVEDRDRQSLDRSTEDGHHQGVIAWLGPFEYVTIESMIKGDEPAMLVALDGVEDPRNLGAILRSAYLLGAGGVIIPEHRAAQVTPLVSKTSAGASELLPIAQVGNLVRALEELRELNVWRVAVHATPNAQPIAKIDGKMPLVLVLGSEGDGVRPLVAKHCDFHALIPMQRSGVGSFN
ncbi:MAG TPA: 23S rRNA (guanosine(2251)-2'-O)-methyltransferase RlmB, partial [Kofleriaceae bacterium]